MPEYIKVCAGIIALVPLNCAPVTPLDCVPVQLYVVFGKDEAKLIAAVEVPEQIVWFKLEFVIVGDALTENDCVAVVELPHSLETVSEIV
ncbi:hypothetical protein HC229_04415 [Flavobacterium sp. D33]|nr:hypothetical protein [Flavobacterium selenitireducens]